MLLNRIVLLPLMMSLMACGEASFAGKGASKSDSKGKPPATDTTLQPPGGGGPNPTPEPGNPESPNPDTTPIVPVPGTENPEIENPDIDDPSVCMNQSGGKVPCPTDPETDPVQN